MTRRHSARVPERDKNLDPLRPVLVLLAPDESLFDKGASDPEPPLDAYPAFWKFLDTAYYEEKAQLMKERYGSLISHPDAEGPATWILDDRADEPTAEIEWYFDGMEKLDAILLQDAFPNGPCFE